MTGLLDSEAFGERLDDELEASGALSATFGLDHGHLVAPGTGSVRQADREKLWTGPANFRDYQEGFRRLLYAAGRLDGEILVVVVLPETLFRPAPASWPNGS